MQIWHENLDFGGHHTGHDTVFIRTEIEKVDGLPDFGPKTSKNIKRERALYVLRHKLTPYLIHHLYKEGIRVK
jgi:hypothetical protein